MQVRFISDYHFGHEFMARLRKFDNTDNMNEHIIESHNRIVHKKDITYILGDISMHKSEYYYLLDRMNGRKRVILGNHDLPQHVPQLLKHVEQVGSMEKYKGIFLTHCPIHPQELEYRVPYNIHGHTHEHNVSTKIVKSTRDTSGSNWPDDKRYINVSCEQLNYEPKTIYELIPSFEEWRQKRNKK